MISGVLFPRRGEYKGLDVLHEGLLFLLASPIELPMGLVNVILDLSEFLHGPLADVDKGLHLGASCTVQSLDRLLQLLLKLAVVVMDKFEYIQHLRESILDVVWLPPALLLQLVS